MRADNFLIHDSGCPKEAAQAAHTKPVSRILCACADIQLTKNHLNIFYRHKNHSFRVKSIDVYSYNTLQANSLYEWGQTLSTETFIIENCCASAAYQSQMVPSAKGAVSALIKTCQSSWSYWSYWLS